MQTIVVNDLARRLRNAINKNGGIFEQDIKRLTDEEIVMIAQIIVLFSYENSHQEENGFTKSLVHILNVHNSKLADWQDTSPKGN